MASHDLQFAVQNGDGSAAAPVEMPRPGEMDHLPPTTTGQQQQPSSAAAASVQYIAERLLQSSHPGVIVFHCLFKLLALTLYIFGGWFIGGGGGNKKSAGGGFIVVTVICILLLAADFWVVKNVTGRLLVGLRWWNKVENESTTWIFESAEEGSKAVNNFDRKVFWTVLYATPVIWSGFFLLGALKLQLSWLIIVVMALALSMANVYGYYKCSSAQQAKFQEMMTQGAQQGAMAVVKSGVLGLLAGTTGAGGTQQLYNQGQPAH